MTHITPTQADRDAALAIWHLCDDGPYSSLPEWLVQAFARHRLAAIEEAAVEAIGATKAVDRKNLTAWGSGYLAACAEIECRIRNLGSPS